CWQCFTRLVWTRSAVKSSVNYSATSWRDSTITAPVSAYRRVSYTVRYSRYIRPRQIWVAIFDIACAFALAIAEFVTIVTAAIGGIVPHTGKAANRPRLQRDRLGQDRPDASHGEQLLVRWRMAQALMDALFQYLDLMLETVQHRKATGDRQHLGLLGQPALEFLLR